jgi:hypothetical protein
MNNQRRMQINDKTSRPCTTRHEIIETIPKRTDMVSPSASDVFFPLHFACATLSGVPRGRCSCRRYHCGSDLLFSFCAQTNRRGIFVNWTFSPLPKKVQKIKTTTRRMEQKGAVEMAADSQEMAFFVRTDRTEKSRPVVALLLLRNGRMGNNKKKITSGIFPSTKREDTHWAKCNATECERWKIVALCNLQIDEIPPIRLHFHRVLQFLSLVNLASFSTV